jgi:hypothetical protein
MTSRFYSNVSGAGGANNGTSWANAYQTLVAAAAGMAAGDTLFWGNDNSESNASTQTINFPGTLTNPNFIYCVDHTQASPGTGDLKTGAAGAGSFTTTGNFGINLNGMFYAYGLYVSAGTGTNTANIIANGPQFYDNCTLAMGATTGGLLVMGTSLNVLTVLQNSVVSLSAPGQSFDARGRLIWRGGSLTGTAPNTLFTTGSSGLIMICQGVDLSNLGNHNLIANMSSSFTSVVLDGCKVPATFTTQSAITVTGEESLLVNCDSGASNYRTEKYSYPGSQVIETTIVRTGGATDGTTPIAWKLATTANSKWPMAFESLPITIWNDTTGSNLTIQIDGIWGGGAVPNNDDIWIEAEYMGSPLTPLASFATASKSNNLATGSALSTDASTWGGSTTPFSMSVTLGTSPLIANGGASPQPGLKGPITIRVKAAKPSSTFYIDPRPIISGVMVGRSEILAPGVYANELKSGGAVGIIGS